MIKHNLKINLFYKSLRFFRSFECVIDGRDFFSVYLKYMLTIYWLFLKEKYTISYKIIFYSLFVNLITHTMLNLRFHFHFKKMTIMSSSIHWEIEINSHKNFKHVSLTNIKKPDKFMIFKLTLTVVHKPWKNF